MSCNLVVSHDVKLSGKPKFILTNPLNSLDDKEEERVEVSNILSFKITQKEKGWSLIIKDKTIL